MAHYKRILLKLSGEALLGKKAFGIDVKVLEEIVDQVKILQAEGIEVGIVIGGGNIFRGSESKELHIDRTTADYMGMLATVINALALQNALLKKGIDARVMSSLSLMQVAEPYILAKALAHFGKGRIVIFAG